MWRSQPKEVNKYCAQKCCAWKRITVKSLLVDRGNGSDWQKVAIKFYLECFRLARLTTSFVMCVCIRTRAIRFPICRTRHPKCPFRPGRKHNELCPTECNSMGNTFASVSRKIQLEQSARTQWQQKNVANYSINLLGAGEYTIHFHILSIINFAGESVSAIDPICLRRNYGHRHLAQEFYWVLSARSFYLCTLCEHSTFCLKWLPLKTIKRIVSGREREYGERSN